MPIQLLIPMSGQGSRYQAAGYREPKPLIPVNGTPMIERLLSVFPSRWPATFVLAENHRDSGLPELLERLRPGCSLLFLEPHTEGPGYAITSALPLLDAESPVLVSYCDYGMIWDADAFETEMRAKNCDACVVSYKGFHPHYLRETPYAYSRLEDDRVVEVREKGSFTDDRQNEWASCGAYYFRSANTLAYALGRQQEEGLLLNGESYTSLTVEALLRSGFGPDRPHVRVYGIERFFQWGTPQDLRDFEYWERTYRNFSRFRKRRCSVDQVLMPMAGLGSRFQHATSTPKPLVPLAGAPMFVEALQSLPAAPRTVVVTLASVGAQVKRALKAAGVDGSVVELESTPAGQALSTEAGLHALHQNCDVVVSSCDHGIVLDPSRWEDFRRDPRCEAAVFTVRGYPGAARRPKAYAYVVSESSVEPFPMMRSVSVKQPVSSNPQEDAVLVGTFWFSDAAILAQGIRLLKEADSRVNGELYLDSVLEILRSVGMRVREIALEGYLCWGDPESLAEATYWRDVFLESGVDPGDRG